MIKTTWRYLLIILNLISVALLSGACGTLEIGIEPSSYPALPTATYEVPPQDMCQSHLELLVSSGHLNEQAVVTCYRCGNAWIDSTGKTPTRSPKLIVAQGDTIVLQLTAEETPVAVDLRLYPETGLVASFFRWPEELSEQDSPVESVQLAPSTDLHYTVQAQPGEYTLVCRVTWENEIDVFYAISFVLEESKE